MKLTKRQEIQALNELLAMLAADQQKGGHGLRTSEMRAMHIFHGGSTLSLELVARLLRESGMAALKESPKFHFNVWQLTDENWDRERFSAAFKKNKDEIKVFCVHHHRDGDRSLYLGTLDPLEEIDYLYEGEYVFNLDVDYLGNEHGSTQLHIPVNVLREIADFGTAPKKRRLRRREEIDNTDRAESLEG